MDDLFFGAPSQISTNTRHDYEDTTSNVPEPPMDLDGLLLSQAFNGSSQNQFSLTQLNSSQIHSSRKRPSDNYQVPGPSQKVTRRQRSPQVGVTPSPLVRPGRVTRPIFKPPMKSGVSGNSLTGEDSRYESSQRQTPTVRSTPQHLKDHYPRGSGLSQCQTSMVRPTPPPSLAHSTDSFRASQPQTPMVQPKPQVSANRFSGGLGGSQRQTMRARSPLRAVAAVTPSVNNTPAPVRRGSQMENIDTPHYPLCLPGETPGGGDRGLIKLRPVAEIASQYRSIFPFPYFNIVQSKIFDDVMYSDKAMVLCAPTGSGKTVLFELAIIRLLVQRQHLPSSNYKVVYMAPMKALCSERYEDWTEKFGPHGLKCKELTGDTELDDYFELQDVHIVLTTPEKWDSMTRKWRDNKSLVQMVRLFLVDEVHMVNDSSRGATMEAVVSRMKTVESALTRSAREIQSDYSGIRFMAVSATVPNVQDVAAWLDRESTSAVCHSFDDSSRPVRLRKVVLGFPCSESTSEFKFDLSLNYKLAGIIETYSDQKPTLVFCATRKSVQQAASTLVKEARFIMNSQHKQRLQIRANTLRESKLRDLVLGGVGYHHAGLDLHDRKAVEELFLKGDLPVLIATSTLAMGVNLPAHLVVIKSTQHYVMGLYQEYSETQVLQMIGRAGRPQFDTSATAVIMTRTNTKRKYDDLLQGNQMVESSLHKNLVEHLNAEIVLETINDVSVALEWLKSTFLYIRVMKNPKHYGYPEGQSRDQIDNKLQELCLKNLNSLAGINLLKMGPDGFTLKATEIGRLMARYCVAFETMKRFQEVGSAKNLNDLLVVLCGSKEFRDVHLRNNEKKILNTLNKDKNRLTIRFPMEGKIKTNEMKVNCLVQAQLGSLSVQDFALAQDTGKIFRSTVRISRCLLEVHWHRTYFKTLMNAVLLAKCCKAKLWENSKHISRQLTGIGTTLSNALVNAGMITFQKIEDTNPREIELIVNRHPPFGNQVRDAVSHLPKYEVCIDQSTAYRDSKAEITVTVSMANRELVGEKSSVGRIHTSVLLIGDADNNIVYKAKISDAFLLKNEQWHRRVDVQRSRNGEELSVNLISQDFVGLDVQSTYTPFYTGPKRIQRVQVETSSQKRGADAPKTSRKDTGQEDIIMLGPNRRPCSHTCNNKNTCSHDCCKHGVLIRPTNPRSSMMDNLRRELHQRKDQLPKTPLRPLKIEGNEANQRNKQQSLQQFAYKPTQDKIPVSTPKQKPGVKTVHDHPIGSGWENIDLCQQRAKGTQQWNLRQPYDEFMHEVLEINSSDDDLMVANSRWYQEADGSHPEEKNGRNISRYNDYVERCSDEDDFLPDLVPNQEVVYDKWGRMQMKPNPTATLSRNDNNFNELDPPIDDFSPEAHNLQNTPEPYHSQLNLKPFQEYQPIEEVIIDDFKECTTNESQKLPLNTQQDVLHSTEPIEDRVNFDLGYDDLGSSFSDESPVGKSMNEFSTNLNKDGLINHASDNCVKCSLPYTTSQESCGRPMAQREPNSIVPNSVHKLSTTINEFSSVRSEDASGSMFDNIFEGIF